MTAPQDFSRYHRQMILPGIGEAGQERLAGSHAAIIGCGALGSVIADSLTRAGVGRLTIIDRDVVEITNLQRQILFDEEDVRRATPKAEAAKAKLARINSQVEFTAIVDDFNARNAEALLGEAQIVLDGLDNFETRYLINDLAVKRALPYIYGGAVGASGMTMAILAGSVRSFGRANVQGGVSAATRAGALREAASGSGNSELPGPCLRCVFPDPPPPGLAATCDTAGVLGPVVSVIASHQSAQAIKILSGNVDAADRSMLSVDLWSNEMRRFNPPPRDPACPCCGRRNFEFLEGQRSAGAAMSLCGRNAVQINPSAAAGNGRAAMDLAAMSQRLAAHGRFSHTEYLLRGEFTAERGTAGEPIELMLFPTGRAIIRGTDRPEVARSIYARYIGA